MGVGYHHLKDEFAVEEVGSAEATLLDFVNLLPSRIKEIFLIIHETCWFITCYNYTGTIRLKVTTFRIVDRGCKYDTGVSWAGL